MNFKRITMAKVFSQFSIYLTTIIVSCELRFRVFASCQLFIYFFFGHLSVVS